MMATADRPGVCERTWTKEEYYRLGELGFFRGQRVELIGGQLMVMSPQGPPHMGLISTIARVLDGLFAPHFYARQQGPIDLGATTEPEPDIAVVVCPRQSYLTVHPTHAHLIIEIGDSTLTYDRGRKASLYASAGIADYWIVNLVTPQVEVYRDPVPDAAEPFGHRYTRRADHLAGDTVSPLALPAALIPVVDLLP
jgi:Uma2 family endonuclease